MTVTYQDLVGRYDLRLLIRLCFDDEERHFEKELSDNAVITAAIEDARGAIQSAIEVAGMYKESDLDRLTPSSVSLYKRLVCDKAVSLLYKRRGQESGESISKANEAFEEYLDRIRKGERIFTLLDSNGPQEAGNPSLGRVSVIRMNSITDRVRGYFGDVYRCNSSRELGYNR